MSARSYQPINPGDLNLMIAGKGIAYSEREHPEVAATNYHLNGLQLWLTF
ncbi:pirin family protein [Marinobacter xestospongiae]